ncbi:MAG: hypothetical protein JWO38_2684, partial [Gemmataceae bacterium]|nr:hypothetical protein [Gemmataceae bacterium]
MTNDVIQALGKLAGWLAPRLEADPELRAAVAALARAAAGWVESLGPP